MGIRKFSPIGAAQCQALNKSNKKRCSRMATTQLGKLALCPTHYEAKRSEKK